jgi:hypothetical protein
VVIEDDQTGRPGADIYGGLALSTCTSGFSVRHNSSGSLGIVTAAHCPNSQSYLGSSLPFQSEAWGGWYDQQWHTAPGFVVRNWMYDGSGTRSITSRTLWGYQYVGEFVCKYGKTTGYGCGTIAQ